MIIAITETWLQPFMHDAQVALENFNIFKTDRVNRDRGGVVLYVNDMIPIDQVETFDDKTCQGVICTSTA